MPQNNVPARAGVVIGLSKQKLFLVFTLLVLFFVVGLTLIWAWWTETPLPLPILGERIHQWGWLTGSLMTSMAALFIPMAVVYYFAKEKIILADDRVQILQNDRVVVQLPYRNISRTAVVDRDGVKFLGIDLDNLADPETFVEVGDLASNKAEEGWHFSLQDVYERPLVDICKLIEAHLAKVPRTN